MIRPTSEDVITGQIFSTLKCINPRWWVPDLLNLALGENRFRRKLFRKLQIDVWVRQKGVPKYLVPWDEGPTEVDVVLTWENPPTTVFIEMKYGSPLAKGTSRSNEDRSVYPADQLIRNIRVGLWKCGWFTEPTLFATQPRDFYTILISPKLGNDLVSRYRSNGQIYQSLPYRTGLAALPREPFVGEVCFRQLEQILSANRRHLNWSERTSVAQLIDYLAYKRSHLKPHNSSFAVCRL